MKVPEVGLGHKCVVVNAFVCVCIYNITLLLLHLSTATIAIFIKLYYTSTEMVDV